MTDNAHGAAPSRLLRTAPILPTARTVRTVRTVRTGLTRRALLIGGGMAAVGAVLPTFSGVAVPVAAAADIPRDGTRPADGTLTTQGNAVSVDGADVNARDYVINATFRNPPGGDRMQSDYGFEFRAGDGGETRVYVVSDGTWIKSPFVRAPDGTNALDRANRRTGAVAGLKRGAGETNDLQVIVTGDVGELLVNGRSVTGLNLAGNGGGGAVRIGAGFLTDSVAGQMIEYRNFYVAQPPEPSAVARRAMGAIYGPATGGIRNSAPGMGTQEVYTGASLRDGTIAARFSNPFGAAHGAWDYGFAFRGSDTKVYRVMVLSDKTWRFVYGAQDAQDTSRQSFTLVTDGMAAPLRVGDYESNDVVMQLRGASGTLLVNGVRLADLDLGANGDMGTVTIGTQFFSTSGIEDMTTGYEDFLITP